METFFTAARKALAVFSEHDQDVINIMLNSGADYEFVLNGLENLALSKINEKAGLEWFMLFGLCNYYLQD